MTTAGAAQAAESVPEGLLTLSASATLEVPRDWMSLTLSVTREGSDATAVQTQLKLAVDKALAEARRVSRPGQVEVQTGSFSVFPRYGQKGQLSGWQGSTELVLEGRDMVAISELSGKISSMSVSQVSYTVSREARERVESELTAQAVTRFRARAAEQAKLFGYGGYVLREANVSIDQPGRVMPMARAPMAKLSLAEDAPLPVEAGKGTVSATVSGSVQLK